MNKVYVIGDEDLTVHDDPTTSGNNITNRLDNKFIQEQCSSQNIETEPQHRNPTSYSNNSDVTIEEVDLTNYGESSEITVKLRDPTSYGNHSDVHVEELES